MFFNSVVKMEQMWRCICDCVYQSELKTPFYLKLFSRPLKQSVSHMSKVPCAFPVCFQH